MSRRYKLRAEYPLAGSDDGLPVTITFNHVPAAPPRLWMRSPYPGHQESVEYVSVALTYGNLLLLPEQIQKAIQSWAADYLESDEGEYAAVMAVDASNDAAREIAAELRREP